LSSHATRKELHEALLLFDSAVSKKKANAHTYCAMLNCHVRCGNVAGAVELFDTVVKEKLIKLDVILCTTMMKGHCEGGDVNAGDGLLAVMKSKNVLPNIRTINTYLRGCIMSGAIAQADAMVIKMPKEYQVLPDVSSWEYLVVLLCQGLRLDKVLPLLGRLKQDASMASGMAAMHVCTARAAALLGDAKNCKKAMQGAKDALSADVWCRHNNNDNDNDDDEQDSGGEEEDEDEEGGGGGGGKRAKKVTGGKQAWKAGTGGEEDARAQSLAVFREHRRAELLQELQLIEEFVTAQQGSSSSSNSKKQNDLLPCFKRALSFPLTSSSSSSSSSTSSVVDALMEATRVKFGLEAYLKTRIPLAATVSSPPAAAAAASAATAKVAEKSKKQKKKVLYTLAH